MPEPPRISATSRADAIDHLERERFDCVVIGGGITGAGIALEAGLRGLRVALLEAEDFAAGTSSRSTKLIHGGLRYLAMGEVALVRSTALERKEIHRLAPHLAEPRWMVLPVRSRAALAKFRVGLATYERLGAVEGADRHRSWGRDELAEHEPAVDRERFPFACAYREYLSDDARLVLANLRASVARGARVLNHARVDAILRDGGKAAGVEAVCGLSGRRLTVRARCVMNAAGPWVDAVRRLEETGAPARLHLSKGVHVSIPAAKLPVRNMLMLDTEDRRTVFVIRRGPVTYVGTTDTTYQPGSEVWPAITGGDVDYLLEPLGRYLTRPAPKRADVVAAWAGLRPLIAEPGKKPTEISRRDEVWVGPLRVLTIAGGKLTGYRPMVREAIERAAEACGLSLDPAPERERPLPGGDFEGDLGVLAERLARDTGAPPARALRLVRLYGSEAAAVVALGPEPLVPGADVIEGEVDWAVSTEGAARLEDVIYRRTRAALYDPGAREAALEPAARRMAAALGWSAERRDGEIARARARLAEDLRFATAEAAA